MGRYEGMDVLKRATELAMPLVRMLHIHPESLHEALSPRGDLPRVADDARRHDGGQPDFCAPLVLSAETTVVQRIAGSRSIHDDEKLEARLAGGGFCWGSADGRDGWRSSRRTETMNALELMCHDSQKTLSAL